MTHDKQKKLLQQIKKQLIDSEEFDYYYNSKDGINCENETFMWVSAQKGMIGHWECHYEFVFDDSDNLNLEVHFKETENKEFDSLTLPCDFTFAKWKDDRGTRKIVYKESPFSNKRNITAEYAYKVLKEFDAKLGKKIVKIIKKNDILKPKEFSKKKFGAAQSVKKEEYEVTQEAYKTTYVSIHKKIQNALKAYKKDEYATVETEKPLGGIRVDVVGIKSTAGKEVYDLYEVKPYDSATDCIREALGQILLYKHTFETNDYKVGKLYVVGPAKMKVWDEDYLKFVNERLNGIKINYLRVSG